MNSEIASALARFFDGAKGPSHDELDRIFQKSGLARFDPAPNPENREVGKMKRVRTALIDGASTDRRASLEFVLDLTAMLKARGCFIPTNDQFAGEQAIGALGAAMKNIGWVLDRSGDLFAENIAGLEGRQLSEALQQYVKRIQRGVDDSSLTIGSAKELLEAAARHILVESDGTYDQRADFPTTYFRASTVLGVGVPTGRMIADLHADPMRAVEQGLGLAAIAINRLRNTAGTGHGRPAPSRATRRQGIIAAQSAAAICYVLLGDLTS